MTDIIILKKSEPWKFYSSKYEKTELLYIENLISNLKKDFLSTYLSPDTDCIDVGREGKNPFYRIKFFPHHESDHSLSYIVNPLEDSFLKLIPLETNNITKDQTLIKKAIMKTSEEYPKVPLIDKISCDVLDQIWDDHFKDEIQSFKTMTPRETLEKIEEISVSIAEDDDFFTDKFCESVAEEYKVTNYQFSDDFRESLMRRIDNFKLKNGEKSINMNQIGRLFISENINNEAQERYQYEKEKTNERNVSLDTDLGLN